jgi:hypothetical protein
MRQPVKPGVDFAEFLTGMRGFKMLKLMFHTPAPVAPWLPIILARHATDFSAGIPPPVVVAVIVVIVAGVPDRLAAIVIARLEHAIEPFPNRHPGLSRGGAGGIARFWTEASEIPRTARFHFALKPLREEQDGAVSSCGSLTDEAEGAILSVEDRPFRIRVNKRLMDPPGGRPRALGGVELRRRTGGTATLRCRTTA